jgi:hypothetical protein
MKFTDNFAVMSTCSSMKFTDNFAVMSTCSSMKFAINLHVLTTPIICSLLYNIRHRKKTPWPESEGELYLSSDRRLSTKLMPTFEGRGCHVTSATDPCGRKLDFQDRKRYFFSFSMASISKFIL